MNIEKITKLIDKVVGKDGPFQAPSFWVHKLFTNLIENLEELGKKFERSVSNIENKTKALIANCVKSIPHYSYEELQKMADNNQLIPGQTYYLDFNNTVTGTNYFNEIDGYTNPSESLWWPFKLYITANSTNSFFEDATCYYNNRVYFVKYVFYRDFIFTWCPRSWECSNIEVHCEELGGTINFSRKDIVPNGTRSTSVRYDNGNYILRNRNNSAFSYDILVGDTVKIYSNATSNTYTGTVKAVTDRFSGIIYEWYDPTRNIKTPFPPDSSISMTFSAGHLDEDKETLTKVRPYDPYYWRNLKIEPYVLNNSHYLPRIYLSPLGHHNTGFTIDRSTSIVYIQEKIGDETNANYPIHIGTGCSNILLKNFEKTLNIPNNSDNLTIIGVTVILTSGINNLTAKGDISLCRTKSSQWTIFRNHNLLIDATEQQAAGLVFLPIDPNFVNESSEPNVINLKEINAQNYNFIGKDSNGNIRCWNPADFIDVVDVE